MRRATTGARAQALALILFLAMEVAGHAAAHSLAGHHGHHHPPAGCCGTICSCPAFQAAVPEFPAPVIVPAAGPHAVVACESDSPRPSDYFSRVFRPPRIA